MKSLVEGLLTMARADAGTLEMQKERLDPGALVRESVELAAPLARRRQVRLSVAAPAVEVTGDPGRLAQVVTNLLANAIHYNRPEGEVRVSLEAVGADAVLAVADTGCGIPKEDRPHLFERFYRVDRARELGGSGLGLALCKSIVDAHGGTISFTTEVGQGSNFVVRLALGAPAPGAYSGGH
jgi:signal transduction histidine kinase